MKKNHIGKILAVGIIVLFIGVGIHFAFAVEDKASTESLTVDFDNENNSEEILDDWDIDISFYPKYPNGENNWYISCVTLTITYNNETIKNVYVNGIKYIEPIIFCEEGVTLIEITAEDWAGNWMDSINYELPIDYSPPEIECYAMFRNGKFHLGISGGDIFYGVNRVEFYIGGTLETIDNTPPYTCTIDWQKDYSSLYSKFKFVVYDNAGNFVECYPFPETSNFYIIGFICNPIFSEPYFGFFARCTFASGLGIVKSEYLEFVTLKYSGFIGKNFIFTKISGWRIDPEGILLPGLR